MKDISRNDPCPCGSGRKYKHCCLQKYMAPATNANTLNNVLMSALEHHQAGRIAQAETLYRQILQSAPDHPDALHLLGLIVGQAGESKFAIDLISKAISANPSNPLYYNNLGMALKATGNLDRAAASFSKALSLNPRFAEAHNNLGTVFVDQGKLDESIACYRKALALKPDYAEAYSNMGHALKNQGELDESAVCLNKALMLKPDYAKAYGNLGGTLQALGNTDAAYESYKKALAIDPCLAIAHVGLGSLYLDLGRFEAAEAALVNALKHKPDCPAAWVMLPMLRKMTRDDAGWLETALKLVSPESPALPMHDTTGLYFAIGKYYDDTQQYDLAFSAYNQANTLARRLYNRFDRAGLSGTVDALIATYTADFLGRERECASQSQRPVLIVGMPRSGTSLTEQIIASHPDAFGAGELLFWRSKEVANESAVRSGSYDPAFIAGAANEYDQLLRQYSAQAIRVVDKMPGNFIRLGLINSIFPNARIIHMQRNPLDTCLSIYFQNFNCTHSYATDLEDIAFYYREYARLMGHWRSVLPAKQFLEVPYESLIEDTLFWSRKIIEFTGLDWDERCLDFHKTERKVGTSSNWQVRQKIYPTSKERWRNYEKYLGPLLDLPDANLCDTRLPIR